MKTRIELQEQLVAVLGSNQVYFQPPSNVQMKYPAIVYELSGELVNKADNKRFMAHRKYTITHIYKSISNCLMDKMLDSFMYIEFDRQLIADGLYQDVYTIYW